MPLTGGWALTFWLRLLGLSFKYSFVSKCRQRPGTQSIGIALALLGQRDDPLCNDLIHDLGLAGVVQGFARLLVGAAQRLDRFRIKGSVLEKIENGPHLRLPECPCEQS